MTNLAGNNMAHTQQQLNRPPRKRKPLAETTGNPRPCKRVFVDAASSKRRQPSHLIATPPLTERTPEEAADTVSHGERHNCDHIWELIRERKARQYSLDPRPAAMDVTDGASAISGTTTATQAKKDQQRFAEEVLHPRWIAIRREKNPFAKPLSVIQEMVRVALHADGEPNRQPADFKSIIGDELFASVDGEQGKRIKSWLKYLRDSHASEAQWESILWRPWFLKDSLRTPPDCDPPDSKPFMGRIVQAKMSLSSGGAVIPPLLASAEARRQSGWDVAPVPWNPNLKKQKGNHVLWYPDYLYAVSRSSLELRIQDLDEDLDVDELPAFRLAQYKYLPANWLAEVKSEDTESNHLAAENYSALMSAYLLHERLLLRWIAKNESVESKNPVEFDDGLAVHCVTCCGPTCKIWRMSIRTKETSSHLEPVRYDMRLLDTFNLERKNGDQRLCNWINALNALALTVQFDGIIADLEAMQANASSLSTAADHSYSWTSRVGFVYVAGSATEISVAPLNDLRKAYNNGAIRAEEPIGDKVIQEWDEKGQALEVDIAVPKARRARRNVRGSNIPRYVGKGKQTPEPSVLPGPSSARSAGNVWRTQFAKAELRHLRFSVVERIARVFSAHINSSGDVGITKEEHMEYITRAQLALAAEEMRMDDVLSIWKDMRLSKGDLGKLRMVTLSDLYKDIGAGEPGSQATKEALVAAIEQLLAPSQIYPH